MSSGPLTKEETQVLLDKLGFTSEDEMKDAARLCYQAAWDALDTALSVYETEWRNAKVPGELAFAVWDKVMNEAINAHNAVRDLMFPEEEAA